MRPSDLSGSKMIDDCEIENNDRQFVTALARGLDILGAFSRDDRFLSNNEIAKRTGLAKPTVSRLTYTLTKTGHLLRDAESGEYRLSVRCLQLGFSVLAATNMQERFAAEAKSLTHAPNPYVTAALAEASRTRAVYIAVHRSHQAVSLSMNVGARLPLFYSGVGRAILIGMDDDDRQAALEAGIREFPEQRERMEHGIRAAFRDYEQYGYCTCFGEWKPEINGIAAPLTSLDGLTHYGMNTGAPAFLISPEDLHKQYGPLLLEITGKLGSQKNPKTT